MAGKIAVQAAERVFEYNGTILPEISPSMKPEQIREHYSTFYPELSNALVEGPEIKGSKMSYRFVTKVGVKG